MIKLRFFYCFIIFLFYGCKNSLKEEIAIKTLDDLYENPQKFTNTDSLLIAIKNELSSKNIYAMAKFYTTFGKLYSIQGTMDSAIAYHLKSLEFRLQLKADSSKLNGYLNLSDLYATQLDTFNMQKMLDLGSKHLKNASLKQQVLFFFHAGSLQSMKGKYNKALKLFDKARIKAIQYKMPVLTIQAYENLANSNLLNQNIDLAITYYNLAKNYYIKTNDSINLSTLYLNISEAYWQKNNLDSVNFYLHSGWNYCSFLPDMSLQKSYIYFFANYFGEKGDVNKCNTYLWRYQYLTDSLYDVDMAKNTALLNKNYYLKTKNLENTKLKLIVKQKNTLRNSAIILAALLGLLGIYQYKNYKQKQKLTENEKQIKDRQINELLKNKELKNMDALLEGREEERKRIGRDLHDRLGSMLSVVKLHFSAIETKIDNLKQENQSQYNKATALLDEAVGEVRKIAHDLVTGTIVSNGLSAALAEIKETIEESGKLKLTIFQTGTFKNKNLEFEIAIYRIIQELINNVLKHANASKIDIHLTQTNTDFTLIVEDNGIGFETKNEFKSGIGIANVKQRVEKLGGVLTIDSNKGKGTSVIIEIENTNSFMEI